MASIHELLGFEPSELVDEVGSAISEEISRCVGNIKMEILKAPEFKRSARDGESESVDKYCKLLQDKLTKEFAKNFEKFELYASRNIFVHPDSDLSTDSNGSAGSATAKLVDEELEETKVLTVELTQLRRRYLGLTSECRELEQLLADMKSSLFGLRVGAQVFEQLSAQQLGEAVAEISDYKRVLLEHVSRANDLTHHFASTTDAHNQTNSNKLHPIKAGNVDDLNHLMQDLPDP